MLENPENFATPLFPPPTSVHLPETNTPQTVQRSPAKPALAETASVLFRHSGWYRRRQQVRNALMGVGVSAKRIAAFNDCGWGGWVWQDKQDPNRFKVTANHCHDRWCLPCGAARGRTIARNLATIAKDQRIRFVTLTLHHRDQPLDLSLKQLGKYFSRLRRTKFWKSVVTAGAAFLEVKRSPTTHGWHPHLHIVVTGKYIPHAMLKAIWHRITGDSYIVDIRPVRSHEQLIRYVTKYVSKPLDNSIFESPETTEQAIRAMHGKRTCTTFGAWRGQDLTSESDETEWISVAPLAELLRDARNGDEGARYVLSKLHVESISPERPET